MEGHMLVEVGTRVSPFNESWKLPGSPCLLNLLPSNPSAPPCLRTFKPGKVYRFVMGPSAQEEGTNCLQRSNLPNAVCRHAEDYARGPVGPCACMCM
eukprot:1140465-Pelagomonas_calceolata.AAC.8